MCTLEKNVNHLSHPGPLRQVSIKQRDTEADLAKAEPAVEAAMAALDTLNKKVSHPERLVSSHGEKNDPPAHYNK